MEHLSHDLLRDNTLFSIESRVYENEINMKNNHYHKHYEIIIMTQNRRTLYFGDKMYDLSTSQIALIPPYLSHKTESKGEYPQSRILINFTKEFIEKLLPDTSFLNIFHTESHVFSFTPASTKKLHAIADELLQIYLFDDCYKDFALRLKLCELLLQLHAHSVEQSSKVTNSENMEKFISIAHYINNNCHNRITLDLIAEQFKIDRFKLSRYFKTYLGANFVTYVNMARVAHAKEMMENGIRNVTEIAFSNGFESATHFSRVFKSLTGETPKSYINRV